MRGIMVDASGMANYMMDEGERCVESKCPHKDTCSKYSDISNYIPGISQFCVGQCERDNTKMITVAI